MKKGVSTSIIKTAFALLSVAGASAVQVQPTSYTFVPHASVGSYVYADETGTQLTDGQFGLSHINSSSEAYPYVGWNVRSVKIDFTFDDLTSFDSLSVSALQTTLGNIALPDVRVYSSVDGVTWTGIAALLTPASAANNWSHTSLIVDDLNVTTKYLQVQLVRHDAWILADEISFFSPGEASQIRAENAVPEGGSTLLLLGAGFGSLFLSRRKRIQ